MEIVEGRRYVRKDGYTTGPLLYNPDTNRWDDPETNISWNTNGRFYEFGTSGRDLEREFIGEWVRSEWLGGGGLIPPPEAPVADDTERFVRFRCDSKEDLPNPAPPSVAVQETIGDRGTHYGDPVENFGRIAAYWTAHLRARLTNHITEQDVALMMTLLKLARLAQSPDHYDSAVDAAGYIDILHEINQKVGEA